MVKKEEVEQILSYVKEINKLIHIKHHEKAQNHNLTLEQFHLLLYLNKLNTYPTIGEIAKKFNKAQNTVSEKITRLEDKGLLNRVKDENDRRISRVIITGLAKELLKKINDEASNDFLYKAMGNMDEYKTKDILYGLENILLNLKKEREECK